MSKTDAVYVIDGRLVHSLADFYTIVGEAVSGPGGYFGRSLDAFSDCLIGGYGTPADGRFRFVWQYSGESRSALGTQKLCASWRTSSNTAIPITSRRCTNNWNVRLRRRVRRSSTGSLTYSKSARSNSNFSRAPNSVNQALTEEICSRT